MSQDATSPHRAEIRAVEPGIKNWISVENGQPADQKDHLFISVTDANLRSSNIETDHHRIWERPSSTISDRTIRFIDVLCHLSG